MDPVATTAFFDEEKPDAVVLAAAHVGGIMANNTYRAEFIYNNLQIQQNVIGESYRSGVRKLLFLGSSCIYPREAKQPMSEDQLLTGSLEYTNEPYAIAKIAGLKMCESFNLQYGTNYIAVMPTNLYGPRDNFHLENSHVLPAIIRKIHLAKLLHERNLVALRADLMRRPISNFSVKNNSIEEIAQVLSRFGIGENRVHLWGSGSPLREFLWSEDMADAAVHMLLNVNFEDLYGEDDREIRNCHINIGTGQEISIKALAHLIADTEGFTGAIEWDRSKPDGTLRKLTDVRKLHALGWKHSVEIDEGVRMLYNWYLEN